MCDDLPLKVSGSSVRSNRLLRKIRSRFGVHCASVGLVQSSVDVLDYHLTVMPIVYAQFGWRADSSKGRSVSPEFQGLLEMNGSLTTLAIASQSSVWCLLTGPYTGPAAIRRFPPSQPQGTSFYREHL